MWLKWLGCGGRDVYQRRFVVDDVSVAVEAVWCQRGLVPDAVGGAAKGKQKSLLYFNLSTEGKVRQRGTDRQADG